MNVLPCPVCCNPPSLSQVHDEFIVECTHCNFDLRLEMMVDEDHEHLLMISRTQLDAIEVWNWSVEYYLNEYEVA